MLKLRLFLLLLILFPLLTGCWDYRDINMTNISIATGVDIVNGEIEYTGEVVKIVSAQGKSGDKAQSTGVYNFHAYGKDYEKARQDFDSGVPYPHFLGASRAVIFSASYAKQGLTPYLQRIAHTYDYRKTILPVISREPPSELFKVKVENDISVAFLIEDILFSLTKQGKAIYPNVGTLLSDADIKTIGSLIPYVGIKGQNIKYLGMCVLKDLKLIGIIDLGDTSGVLYILAKNPALTETIPGIDNQENKFSFITTMKKRKIKTNYIDGKVIIDIELKLNATLNYQYYPESIDESKLKSLEDMLSQSIRKKIMKIIDLSQKEYACDFIGLARYFKAQNPLVYREINWEESYENAEINVNVTTKINTLGLSDYNAKTLHEK